jgi:hypothetical protein
LQACGGYEVPPLSSVETRCLSHPYARLDRKRSTTKTYFVLLICFRLIPYPLVISFFGSRSSLIDYIGYFYHYLIYQILKPSSKHLYSPNILFIFEVGCCFGIPSMTVLSFHLPFQQIRGSSHTSLFLNSYVKNAISFCKLILLV